ncbi:hypothetical protein [Litchfieldia salsa]|uniref:Uncharacterized protein n=1 Tax=Litchfieldia salsa TaxID=930152 RepID=A0A1H0RN48_9BACI|nr:hypothetical protein [Litchfieldia salsa]SDP30810.1 hypothetical protein SAMN05216565_102298 [Litchfieldia salsa]
MVKDEDIIHEHEPNNDGRYEGVINDSLSSAGQKMGIRSDVNPENINQPKNPYHLKPKEDKELKRFSKLFNGKQ